jgi:hypothetical protein
MGDENYPPLRIPALPGMQVEKDSSDSDPEAVAARKQRKAKALARERAEEEREAEKQREKQKREEELADKDQLLHLLCSEDKISKLIEFMSSIDSPRPEGFAERCQAASSLREKAKASFEQANIEEAIRLWLAVVYCLDFTPRQLKEQTKKERVQVFEALAPILSNLSMASRKQKDVRMAINAALIGLEVVRKTDYQASKSLRIKLRLYLALAYGKDRDFERAREEALHVLDLDPGHEEATCIARNSQIAMKREKEPEERRWKGSLSTPLPQKVQKKQKPSSLGQNRGMLLSFLLPVLASLALYFGTQFMRSVSAAPS